MNNNCEICEAVKTPKHRIIETKYWTVELGNNQAYFGRAFVTLREHKGSLGTLNDIEWKEFEQIVQKLEHAYGQAFGATPLNWGCFMNNAFKQEPANPHVHWHVLPRYKNAPEINGVKYDDQLYGHHYDPDAERLVSDDVVEQIATKLKQYLIS